MKKLILYSIALWISTAYAQKLPNVQQVSLRAPANVKIDGKPDEWGKLKAFNKATELYYTMANDDSNFYLVIQASNPNVLSKITGRGVQLIINTAGKKTDKDAISITFPIFELQYNNKPYIRFSNVGGLMSSERAAIAMNPDSVLRVANKRLHDNEKYIRTSGMPHIDTLLSIYNDKDIMIREGFEKGMVYTYELGIPIKYLKLSLTGSSRFLYHVILKGIGGDDMGIKITTDASGKISVSVVPGAAIVRKEDLPAVSADTDFWGEYTLAK